MLLSILWTTLLSSLETLNHREVHSSEAMAMVQQVPPEWSNSNPSDLLNFFSSSSNKRTICLKWPTYVAICCLILWSYWFGFMEKSPLEIFNQTAWEKKHLRFARLNSWPNWRWKLAFSAGPRMCCCCLTFWILRFINICSTSQKRFGPKLWYLPQENNMWLENVKKHITQISQNGWFTSC